MSDIRLKKITVEPSNTLLIQNGNINITDTTLSNSALNGALIVNGGISINCSSDASSSTSGNALTIGGGLAVSKQTFLGNNFIMSNTASVFQINGISTNRMYLDTISNKHFYLSVDGISKQLDVYENYCSINTTVESVNSSIGALVIQGGIGINTTLDSINPSHGGALTVAGGVAVGGNVIFGKSLTSGQPSSGNPGIIVEYTGNNQINLYDQTRSTPASINMTNQTLNINNKNDIFLYTSSGNLEFLNNTSNSLIITPSQTILSGQLVLSNSTSSVNLTTGSLITIGGITIECSTDTTSYTSGGALTIAGGLGVSKKLLTGNTIGVEMGNNNKNNKIVLYQSSQDPTETLSFTGFGTTNGSLRLQIPSSSQDFTFFNGISEVFRVMGTNTVQFVGLNQRYSIIGGGFSNTDLSFQGQSLGDSSSVNFYTHDGDSLDNNDLKIFGLGLPNNTSSSEYISIGWNTISSNYLISTNKTGSGINRSLVLQSGTNTNQIQLNTNGSVVVNGSINSSNSSTGGLVLYSGGLSIDNNTDASNFTQGGALTIAGGASIAKNIFIGNKVNINTSNGNITFGARNSQGDLLITIPTTNVMITPNDTLQHTTNFSLSTYSNSTIGNEIFSISCNSTTSSTISTSSTNIIAPYNINSSNAGNGVLHPISISVSNSGGNLTQLLLSTNGNIGINNTSPNYTLDINGSFNSNGYSQMNELLISNSNLATTSSSSGSLTVLGGTSIAKNLIVAGNVQLLNTQNANESSGALILSGGMSIQSNQSATYGSGALTIVGGASISQDLYLGGNIYNTGGSANFSNFVINSTAPAINLTTGSIITKGGITIQCSQNSVNVSNGGSLLTPGGASIGRDVYIGGNVFNYGVSDYFTNNNNLINLYDTTNILRFSIDRNTSSNDFSISRYNSIGVFVEKSFNISNFTGIININNSTPSTNLNSSSVILQGGLNINCTVPATNLANGGSLTVQGGVSLNKNLFVGGDTIFSSTTISTSYNDGSVLMYGGVGIAGNLNVLGNTIVNGDFTVLGNTSSINSTNTVIKDNLIILNSGPSGIMDSGFLINRYQVDNNTGTGEVVNDNAKLSDTIPNQSGMNNNQIKFSTLTSSIDDYYKGWWIKITSGFSTNQVRQITSYSGASRVASVSSSWLNQNPALNDTISLYNKGYVGLVYSEINNYFQFGATTQDPGQTTVNFTDLMPISFSSALSNSTQNSTNSTTGGIVSTGGIGISCTTDASNITNGGALTVAGGASIAKTLYANILNVNGVNMTPSSGDILSSTSMTGAQNIITPANLTGLTFGSGTWGFDIYLSAQIIATTSLYSNYWLRGVNKGGSWELVTNYVGDDLQIAFSITNLGQVQYTSSSYPGFVSLIFRFKAITN